MKKKETTKIDIHNFTRKVENARKRVAEDKKIKKINKKHVLSFDDHLARQRRSLAYRDKCLCIFKEIGHYTKHDFNQLADREDIEPIVEAIQAGDHHSVEWRVHMLKTFKTFYKWLKKSEVMPPEVKWINTQRPKNPKINPNQLVTVDEIRIIADRPKLYRDQVFIKLLWESGCRIGEFLGLRIRDVEELDDSCFLHVTQSKTELRQVFVFMFYEDLKKWLLQHPGRCDPENPLWCNMNQEGGKKPLCYNSAVKIFKKAINKTEIQNKKTNLHSLRHSSISHFIQSGELTESEIKMKYWGNLNTQQMDRYGHIDLYKMADRVTGKNGNGVEARKACMYCGNLVSVSADKCDRCGKSLDYGHTMNHKRFLLEVAEMFNRQMKDDPEFAKQIMEKTPADV